KLIPRCILNILRGKELPSYHNAQQLCDWLHVTDHCRAIDRVLREGVAGEKYNISAGTAFRNLDLIFLLCEVADAALTEYSHLDLRFPGCPIVQNQRCDSLFRGRPNDRPDQGIPRKPNDSELPKCLGY